MKKKLLIAAILIVGVLASVYFYAYKDHRNIAASSTDYTFTLEQLKKEFVENDSLATSKYQDKVIEISGKVTAIETENKSVVVDEKMYATFDKAIPAEVKVNDVIQLKGRFLGYDDLLEEFKMDQTTVVE
jgi:predicted negative regulator of RcsB-dependent stress response